MTTRRGWFALGTTIALVAVVALTLTTTACRGDRPDWRIVQLYGGGGSLQAISSPDSVSAFRIEPDATPVRAGEERVGLHLVTSDKHAVSSADAIALATILQDPDTYDWHRAKGCEFRPGVGLRFTRGASRVDIALCFECDMLTIHRHGKRIGVEDFDDARADLVAIAKRTFPDDEQIQALDPARN